MKSTFKKRYTRFVALLAEGIVAALGVAHADGDDDEQLADARLFPCVKQISNWGSFVKSKTLAWAVPVFSLLLSVSGTFALAQESTATADWQKPQSLVGTWRLQVTPVYCPGVTTGKLAAPFQGLVSFTSDGTLTNTFTNTLFGYDTPGHGYWWKTDDHTYKDVVELLIVDPPTTSPFVPGTQKYFGTITLDDENHLRAQVMSIYFDSSDTIYLTKCTDVVGTRLNDSQTEP